MKNFNRKSREIVLKNKWYKVFKDNIEDIRGNIFPEYYVIDFEQQSVASLILNKKNEVLFVEVPRYITDDISLEIPAGGVERNESLRDAAIREVIEETGYKVELASKNYTYFPSNGITNQKVTLFAGKLNEMEEQTVYDSREIIEVKWINSKIALKLVEKGKITDGLTITALLIFKDFLEKGDSDAC